jgi:Bacterial regulatory helix-turn-helix protein, lysR family
LFLFLVCLPHPFFFFGRRDETNRFFVIGEIALFSRSNKLKRLLSGVELRYLKCFVTVAERQSFTRAAEELHVAQPAISQQIKSLEEELGVSPAAPHQAQREAHRRW